MENLFTRTEQLIGHDGLGLLGEARVILFGVGGVGGWCAETLVRSGVRHLTIVDFDVVDPTNVNRQLVATARNIGRPKVEEMRLRLLSINPEADIVAVNKRYTADTALDFNLSSYNYIIDAIDSVADKALLLSNATASSATLFSSMGAGRKLDAGKVRVSEFRKVEGCPLARALRHRFKQTGMFPQKRFLCVWSPEITGESGTMAHIVGTFGMRLTNLLIHDVLSQQR